VEVREYVVNFKSALGVLANLLEVDVALLEEYSRLDAVGGFYEDPHASSDNLFGNYSEFSRNPIWPKGSIWEPEGIVLYLLTRVIQPKVAVDVGSYVGCSLAHIALGLHHNGKGFVYSVDPNLNLAPSFPREAFSHVIQVNQDSDSWDPPSGIGLVHEDASTDPNYLRRTVQKFLSHMSAERWAYVANDPNVNHRKEIFSDIFGDNTTVLIIKPSNAGQMICIKNGLTD